VEGAEFLKSHNFGALALTRIVDTVHFAEKGYSSPLQLADVCAFAIKRHLMKTPENDRFYLALKKWQILLPKEELPN
jgi:hypothetical protein